MSDTDENSTDEKGRKRMADQENNIFSRSAKTARTPGKKEKPTDGDKLEKIMEMMMQITTDIKEIRKENHEYKLELRGLKVENEKIKEDNLKLKQELEKVKERVEKLDRDNRKNNIVVSGWKGEIGTDKPLAANMEKFLGRIVEGEVAVKNAYQLGPKICLVELGKKEDKLKVMQNKKKLKNEGGDRIYINDDWTPEERDVNKKIREIAKEERNKGKQVKLGYSKLTIEGKTYRWNKHTETLEEVSKN
ncbi:hypothetical protein Zmor_006855 [Zophobas morio]|uniref:Uncharacterized protein n=1 Tax=Zophobas morio TaxID=2755281 RepID=A0AA38MLR1_9CUCU|nr:hypothetical protein Zmor_006855 [Zophobas morio]